jgi:hypothetical protein
MSLPQLTGMKCVTCQKSIGSIIDGAFCAGCGNPVHQKCVGVSQQALAERCPQCGGDPNNSLAKEVRRERGAAAQNLARARAQAAGSASSAAYPVASACPQCGSTSHKRQRPEGWVAFTWDRVCTECGTRHTPPTPLWAAFVFLVAGLLLTGFGGVALLMRTTSGDPNPVAIPGMLCEGFLGVIGLLALIHGIRSLVRPGKT